MSSKKAFLLLLPILSFQIIHAQNEVDALRYSQMVFSGTARYNSLSGAFGALGGDLSVTSVNPAGIGVYRSSEFSFTPTIFTSNTTSDYYGRTSEDGKINFNFSNIGAVFTDLKNGKDDYSQWNSTQFAFTFNRHNNFNNRIIISGINPSSSLLDHYAGQINGTNPSDVYDASPFGAGLAWDTYLLNSKDSIDTTTYITLLNSGGAEQEKHIVQTGGSSELDITFSGNYNNKLYIGGTLGFPYINYSEESTYSETDVNDTIANFQSFSLIENLHTSGSGFNFKFGMILRATDWLRLGGAIHTPTFYKLSDEYSAVLISTFDSVPPESPSTALSYTSYSPNGAYDYRLYTPWRIIGSLALIVGKKGLISGDLELIDYSSARLRSAYYGYAPQNASIDQKYTHATNLRIGTEWRFMPFSIRGGYAVYGSPYKNGINDGLRASYSVGFGIREKNFFLDLAYAYSKSTEDYYLYSGEFTEPAVNTAESHKFQSTLGFKF